MNVAVAITMLKTGVDKEKAMDILKEYNGNISSVVNNY